MRKVRIQVIIYRYRRSHVQSTRRDESQKRKSKEKEMTYASLIKANQSPEYTIPNMAYVFNFTISFNPKSRIYAHVLIQTLGINQLGMPLHIRHTRYKADDARRVKCRHDVSRQPGPEERLFFTMERGDVVASFGMGDCGEEILGGWVVNKVTVGG